MLEKVEGSPISLPNHHEVYPCPPIPHQFREIIIMTTFSDILQRDCPCEDSELELQRFGGKADNEDSVFQGLEKEDSE
jgi:hypothetical protein